MIGWKAYFLGLLLFSLTSYAGYKEIRVWEIIDLILFMTSIVGLYGFSWSKKFLTPQFWKLFIISSIIWNTTYNYFIPLPDFMKELSGAEIPQATLATLSLIPYVPCLIGVYIYGFNRPALWKQG